MFENFLKDNAVYDKAQEFLERLFHETTRDRTDRVWTKFLTDTSINGVKFRDQEILTRYHADSRKGLIVVMVDASKESVARSSGGVYPYMRKFGEGEPEELDLLYIEVMLNEESKCVVVDLVEKWVIDDLSVVNMEEYIRRIS